jgi:hypothetical protein
VGGEPLQLISTKAYPQPGETSAMLFVFDLTDLRREDEIQHNKILALQMISQLRPYHSVGLAYYGKQAYTLDPQWTNANDIVESVVSLAALDETPDRDSALINATVAIGSQPAARRALFVLTDGYDAVDDHHMELIGTAQHYGVSINFVTANRSGLRRVDDNVLGEIAAATGGEVIGSKDLLQFLADPYRLLDSGGEAVFSLRQANGSTPAPGTAVRIRIAYGGKTMELSSAGGLAAENSPALGWFDQNRLVLLASAAMFAAIAVTIWLVRRRAKSGPTHGVLGRWFGRKSIPSAAKARVKDATSSVVQAGQVAATTSKHTAKSPMSQVAADQSRAVSATVAQDTREFDINKQHRLEEAWLSMIARMHKMGGLPTEHARLTLAELARQLSSKSGEDDFYRLVINWYYPRQYGQTSGTIGDDDALEIMEGLFR